MKLWDTHCHLFHEYYDSIDQILLEATNQNVQNFIVSGCNTTANQEVLSLIDHYSQCYGVIGIHPEFADQYTDEDIHFLEENLSHYKILGIGEIGLDYHYTKENKDKQKELFEIQLSMAEKWNLPVVIHSRDATEDTIQILKKYHVKGVIHSFSGSLETARIYLKLGFKLGINGVVTFKNSHLKDLLPEIFPNIILETDSPYLTPHPYRGKQNSPKYIKNIAEFIVNELNISFDELEKVTNHNIVSVFDKIPSL